MRPPECDAVTDLLDAAVDGELPPETAAEVMRHAASCPRCAADLAALRSLKSELAALPRPPAPAGLAARIRAALPDEAAPASVPRRRVLELAAAACAGLAIGGGGAWWLAARQETPVEQELLTAHGRALLAGLPLQVASSDSHTVRPWLSTRLPAAPAVAASEGFPLLGARLDLVGGQVVAALIYRRREHVITVFAAAEDAAARWPERAATRRGFTLVPWSADGLRYVALSDLNPAELHAFAALFGRGGAAR